MFLCQAEISLPSCLCMFLCQAEISLPSCSCLFLCQAEISLPSCLCMFLCQAEISLPSCSCMFLCQAEISLHSCFCVFMFFSCKQVDAGNGANVPLSMPYWQQCYLGHETHLVMLSIWEHLVKVMLSIWDIYASDSQYLRHICKWQFWDISWYASDTQYLGHDMQVSFSIWEMVYKWHSVWGTW